MTVENKDKNKKKYKGLKITGIIFLGIIIISISGFFVVKHYFTNQFTNLTDNPKVGEWYNIYPKNAKSAMGKQWHGNIKIGKENKVLIELYGGGVSIDNYTEERPNIKGIKNGFYNVASENGDNMAKWGISGTQNENPFKDWTVIVIPYSTGDFHVGAGAYEYIKEDGTKDIKFHYGYTNYSKMLDEALKYINTDPEALVIAGSSAGGFGAALLADNIIRHFPNTNNITVAVDSSLLLYTKWHETAKNIWHAPQAITNNLKTDNITLDSLVALKKKYNKKVKILFDCSIRDAILSQYQGYITDGTLQSSRKRGDIFQSDLKEMVRDLQNKIPDVGIFIFEGSIQKDTELTQHTILVIPQVFKEIIDNKSIARWIYDAVNNNVKSYGLSLLDKKY
ncbi:pectin acetylesterase-family hydrolase [Paenibacillus sp. PsM32]|uniref:pectin acetylesterase-family hydrolase n=1 Tax=Paenibacillus sp. PsM32 TaxID=3030536 RepID=UPI00263A9F03|nr:pectin acetylesterase-family hydrolase [Paenibacillus sp. PsM32]MDN4618338.1 pectin acetylesterase-family hydrolase [Paenibacillus sp. PsM32]